MSTKEVKIPARTTKRNNVRIDLPQVPDETTVLEVTMPTIESPAVEPTLTDIAPTGTADNVAAIEPPVAHAAEVSESKAAGVLADEKKFAEELIVPATPVPPTAAQISAKMFTQNMTVHAFVPFVNSIPGTVGDFAEPSKEDIKALRLAYAAAHDVDMTDMDAMMDVALTIKDQIDTARNAHNAAAVNSAATNREYYSALRVEVASLLANVDQLIVSNGGKVNARAVSKEYTSASDGTESKTRKTNAKWTEKAPKLIKWATDNKLDGFYLVDIASNGYKGKFHAVKLHTDGQFELCNYGGANSIPEPTGEFVTTPFYFNTEGDPMATHGGERPKYSIEQDAMFGVLMVSRGKIITQEGVNVTSRNGIKPFAAYTVVAAAAGI